MLFFLDDIPGSVQVLVLHFNLVVTVFKLDVVVPFLLLQYFFQMLNFFLVDLSIVPCTLKVLLESASVLVSLVALLLKHLPKVINLAVLHLASRPSSVQVLGALMNYGLELSRLLLRCLA